MIYPEHGPSPEEMGIERELKKNIKEFLSEKKEVKETELSNEEKEAFGEAWVEMIVGSGEMPKDFGEWNNEKIKEWLSETVSSATADVVKAWGLPEPDDLWENAEKQAKKKGKNKVEVEDIYIQEVRKEIRAFSDQNKSERSLKWDSWPKIMKENKAFNCVGGTLVGSYYLEMLQKMKDAEVYFGNPYEHAVNIVKKKDGGYIYADFTNNNIKNIKAKTVEVGGVQALEVDDLGIDYQLIPIQSVETASGSIIGNLASLKNDAENPPKAKTPLEEKEIQEAQEYLKLHKETFDALDFDKVLKVLYPDQYNLSTSPEMEKEKKRLDILEDFDKDMREYTNSLSIPERVRVLREAKKNIRDVENAVKNLELSDDFLKKMSPELKHTLNLLLQSLIMTKEKYGGDIQEEFGERFLKKLKDAKQIRDNILRL